MLESAGVQLWQYRWNVVHQGAPQRPGAWAFYQGLVTEAYSARRIPDSRLPERQQGFNLNHIVQSRHRELF